MRQRQSQLDLVGRNIGVRAPHQRGGLDSGWTNAQGAPGDTEGVHGGWMCVWRWVSGGPMLANVEV